MNRSACWLVASTVALAGCGGGAIPTQAPSPAAPSPATPVTAVADTASRDTPPPFDAPAPFHPAEPATWTLTNGARVVLLGRSEIPVVVVKLVLSRGCVDVPARDRETCRVLDAAMKRGTRLHPSDALGEAFESLGAAWDVSTLSDTASATVFTLQSNLPGTLDLLSEVIRVPSFDAKEVALVRSQAKSSNAVERRDIAALAQEAVSWSTFGPANPYGEWELVKDATVDAVTTESLRRVHASLFSPSHATFVVAGNVDREQLTATLERAFGSWRAVDLPVDASPAQPVKERVVLIDQPGATQSEVLLAQDALPAGSPDRYAFEVMCNILGGDSINGRISRDLREAKGYTYGVTARTRWRRQPTASTLTLGGKVQADKTGASVQALLDQARKMRETDVTDDELTRARRTLGAIVQDFETSPAAADQVAGLVARGLPENVLSVWAQKIDAVTAADVRRAAETYLHPDQMKIVVAGDRKVVEAQLRALGLPGLVVLDADGVRHGS
jgi:zinc protease